MQEPKYKILILGTQGHGYLVERTGSNRLWIANLFHRIEDWAVKIQTRYKKSVSPTLGHIQMVV